jgi:hypothetical protein
VRVYNERSLVSVHTAAAPVMGFAFGRYAREDNTLVTVTRGGGLDIKVGLPGSGRGQIQGLRGWSAPTLVSARRGGKGGRLS